jgi:hypothetical protein
MLRMLGYGCFAFAVVDLGTYYLGIADLTGVSWSPIAAGVVGSILVNMAGDSAGQAADEEPGQETA